MEVSTMKFLVFWTVICLIIVDNTVNCINLQQFGLKEVKWDNKTRKECLKSISRKMEIYSEAHFIPMQSDISLKCPNLCVFSGHSTQHVWMFLPFNQLNVIYIKSSDQFVIDPYDSTLMIKDVNTNGTYFCFYYGVIYAIHSLTLTSQAIPILSPKVSKSKNASYQFKDPKEQVTFELVAYERKKMSTIQSRYDGQISLKRSTYLCYIKPKNSLNYKQLKKVYNLKHKFFPSGLPCGDFMLFDVLSPNQHYQQALDRVKSYVYYDFSTKNGSAPTKSNSSKPSMSYNSATDLMTGVSNLIRLTNSANLLRYLHSNVTMTCAPIFGIEDEDYYYWRKVKKNDTKLNETYEAWISPFLVSRATRNRMRIDFYGNLYIDKLTMNDFKYEYRCYRYDPEKRKLVLFGTKNIKMFVKSFSLLAYLKLDFAHCVIYLFFGMVSIFAISILRTPDIKSKL